MPKLTIRGLPPSVNRLYGRNGKRYFLTSEAKQFHMAFLSAFNAAKAEAKGSLYVGGKIKLKVVFHFADRRRRDADNLIKCLQDCAALCCFGPGDDCVHELIVSKKIEPGIEPFTEMQWEGVQ